MLESLESCACFWDLLRSFEIFWDLLRTPLCGLGNLTGWVSLMQYLNPNSCCICTSSCIACQEFVSPNWVSDAMCRCDIPRSCWPGSISARWDFGGNVRRPAIFNRNWLVLVVQYIITLLISFLRVAYHTQDRLCCCYITHHVTNLERYKNGGAGGESIWLWL